MISVYKIVNKIWPEYIYIYKEVKLKSANQRKNTLRNRNEREKKMYAEFSII